MGNRKTPSCRTCSAPVLLAATPAMTMGPAHSKQGTRQDSEGSSVKPECLTIMQLQGLAKALQQSEGWAWVDVALDFLPDGERYVNAPVASKTLTPEVAVALGALHAEQDRNDRMLDLMYGQAEGEDDADAYEAWRIPLDLQEFRCAVHAGVIQDFEARMKGGLPELATKVGALLTLSYGGGLIFRRNLLRKKDLKAVQQILAGDS